MAALHTHSTPAISPNGTSQAHRGRCCLIGRATGSAARPAPWLTLSMLTLEYNIHPFRRRAHGDFGAVRAGGAHLVNAPSTPSCCPRGSRKGGIPAYVA